MCKVVAVAGDADLADGLELAQLLRSPVLLAAMRGREALRVPGRAVTGAAHPLVV